MSEQKIPEAVKLGKSLREYRRSHGITREQLAEKVGVSFEWLGRRERGSHFPNWLLLIKIAKVLHIKVHDLIPF
jgi:DNA-binding XRE family transcriptional regulator